MGYDITNVSCDTYSYSLVKEAYTDLSFDFDNIKLSLIEDKPLRLDDEEAKIKYNQEVLSSIKIVF